MKVEVVKGAKYPLYPPSLLGNRHVVVRMELWSFHGWKSGTSAVLFSMAAEAGGRK